MGSKQYFDALLLFFVTLLVILSFKFTGAGQIYVIGYALVVILVFGLLIGIRLYGARGLIHDLVVANSFVASLIWVYLLLEILIYGGVVAKEPNIVVLLVEILWFCFMIPLSLYVLVKR